MRLSLLLLLTLLLCSFAEVQAGTRTTSISGPNTTVPRNSVQTFTTVSKWSPVAFASMRGHFMSFTIPAGMQIVSGSCTLDDNFPNGVVTRTINPTTGETAAFDTPSGDVDCVCTLQVNVGTTSGRIDARYKVDGNSESSQDIAVNVQQPLPAPTFSLSGTQVICAGVPRTFQIISNRSTSYSNVVWNIDTPASATVTSYGSSAQVTVNPPYTNTSFYLTATFTPSVTGQRITRGTNGGITDGQGGCPFQEGQPEGLNEETVVRDEVSTITSGQRVLLPFAPSVQTVTTSSFAYPNPTAARLTVPLAAGSGSTVVSVYDANGRRVLRREAAAGTPSVHFDVSDLKPGSYVLRMEGGGRTTTQQVIVQ